MVDFRPPSGPLHLNFTDFSKCMTAMVVPTVEDALWVVSFCIHTRRTQGVRRVHGGCEAVERTVAVTASISAPSPSVELLLAFQGNSDNGLWMGSWLER